MIIIIRLPRISKYLIKIHTTLALLSCTDSLNMGCNSIIAQSSYDPKISHTYNLEMHKIINNVQFLKYYLQPHRFVHRISFFWSI